jgi:hypothetical protein
MSNDYDGIRNWTIDTSENIDGTFVVDYMEWHPNAKNDTLAIVDANSDPIWNIKAAAAASSHEAYAIEVYKPPTPRKCRGIYITISAGTLYVFLNKNSPTG